MTAMFSIPCPEIFNYGYCLRFLSRSSQECLFSIENDVIRTLFHDGTQYIFIEIEYKEPAFLTITYQSEYKAGDDPQKQVTEFVTDWLDLKTPVEGFYQMASKDQLLAPLVQQYHGLRLIGIPDLFEAIAWSIIGQQINLTFAYSLKRQLVDKFGYTKIINGKTYFAFPDPQVIAELSIPELKAIQFSRQKADYLIGVAKAIKSGALTKDKLSQLSYENAKSELIRLRGIGNWSANYVLMKCFRHSQAFPIEDVGLHNAIKKQLGLDKKPTIETIKKMAQPWGEWRAYATFYLWHSLLD